ncbi:leucyl aminopeptidase [Amnibacterium kyonggiense]|uniref:Probable cytosol aminopeptidase n=1 Tax=Amnibacterium kyonggiense TaxID=595671 RepID=A0A4R7FM59_9MICO|nr:leucyl aminopeptidase [Amnibacterium kyonggiense]TDS77530.1 leucyl aminopeptidase [Amnibacterium kyonggiense]
MTAPELIVTSAPAAEVEADVLVVAVRSTESDGAAVLGDVGAGIDLGSIGFTGTVGDGVRLPAADASAGSLLLIGVGRTVDPDGLRAAAANAVRRLAGTPHVALALPVEDGTALAAVLEGAALGTYAYTDYRERTKAAQKAPVARVTVVAPESADADAAVRRATVLADAVALVKDLVNTPPNDQPPAVLADRAVEAAEAAGATSRVWDEAALAEDGFGGILGVGAGSVRPPRLVRVGWEPEGAEASVALVGKGITFDSGGLSLKPAASMVGMKYDMTGAATVLAVVAAAARLALPVRVVAWLCIAENLPSGSAVRPNDVLRIRGGRTVEVLNTDAEGRLVMADGLVVAGEEHPDLILDVATLTGAVITALGTRYTGAMGDGALVARTQAAAKRAGELLWHLPLPEELRTILNSDVADIANVKIGNTAGGALVAGQFLKEFVPEREDGSPVPWVHLDIAGSSENKGGAYGATGSGPTGVMVRTLLALLEDVAAEGVAPSRPAPGRE